jgi:hypothetical protein
VVATGPRGVGDPRGPGSWSARPSKSSPAQTGRRLRPSIAGPNLNQRIAKFRVPAGGGRPTDPRWTERRPVPLAPETLERLEEITSRVRERRGVNVEPMQLAALLLEKTARPRVFVAIAARLLRQDGVHLRRRRRCRACVPRGHRGRGAGARALPQAWRWRWRCCRCRPSPSP